MPDFNFIAKQYDRIKKLIFGSILDEAAAHFTPVIKSDALVLIIGGGSGLLLEKFPKVKQIVYVDSSLEMIKLAKARQVTSTIEFINSNIKEIEFHQEFDVVITPFILDCFNQKDLEDVFSKINNHLKLNAFWLQTDFYPKNVLHKFFIKFMYLFFRLGAKLETLQLPNFEKAFHKEKFKLDKKVLFWGGMVESRKYWKIA